jgi:sugar porter (SP) family MFS transporter
MNRLLYWSLTSALAGFLFGFDTVVISGAEQKIQALWNLNGNMHGWAMSAALWGTVLGALLGGWPTDHWGRKKTLLSIGVLYLVSAVWSGLATDVYTFIIARFIGGLGVGISTVAAPLYIAEIAPPGRRGRLAGMFQFNIVLGILIAFLSNAALGGTGANDWRWMLGIEAVPAVIYAVMCLGLPESPRWLLVKKGDRSEALRVMGLIDPGAGEDALVERADTISRHAAADPGAKGRFWSWRLRLPIALAFLLMLFSQLSGVNAILYFAPRSLEMTGLGENAALLQSVGIGVTNMIFTIVGLYLIDRLGRRILLLIGAIGYVLALGTCSWAFYTETYAVVPWAIFGFIAAFAMGMGAVVWVYVSEIFPDAHRASGQTVGSATHWVSAALVTYTFPLVVDSVPTWGLFLFFSSMMVLHVLQVIFMVPETKGVPLEEMEEKLGLT